MIKPLIAAVACCAALTPATHASPPAPQLVDLPRDTLVPAHDILSGRLSSVLVRGRPAMRAELRLMASPSTPVTYAFSFVVGCSQYAFELTWTAPGQPGSATFDTWAYCHEMNPVTAMTTLPEQPFPVEYTIRGTTVTWQMPFVRGIRRGLVLTRPSASACTKLYCVTGLTDTATGHTSYVVGSDLPRR